MTAPAQAPTYHLIEWRDRIVAVDENDIEIAGAFKPAGHNEWRIYATRRLTEHTHFVLAPTRQIAEWHLVMICDAWAEGQR